MNFLSGYELFDAVQNATLVNGTGERKVAKHVTFQDNFNAPPKVTLSLTRLDFGKDNNQRVLVDAKSVTNSGFDLEVTTWADTKLHSAGVTWLAHCQ